MATRFEVASYVESDGEEKVSSAKPEQHFNDLGLKVTVWNVKTDKGAWWVRGPYEPVPSLKAHTSFRPTRHIRFTWASWRDF
jgi:hypothetical protein